MIALGAKFNVSWLEARRVCAVHSCIPSRMVFNTVPAVPPSTLTNALAWHAVAAVLSTGRQGHRPRVKGAAFLSGLVDQGALTEAVARAKLRDFLARHHMDVSCHSIA